MLVTYDDQEQLEFIAGDPSGDRATLWVGDPYYAGMDIIWGMEDKGDRWKKGSICDPEEGKIYASEMWIEKGNLMVRGKIGPFGRNQTWIPLTAADLPPGIKMQPVSTWKPVIPVKK